MLSPTEVIASFPQKTLNHSLFVFDELSSTNTFALEIARKPLPNGTLVLADRQSAGRGRMQRTWFSPPGTNIYGSLIFSFTGQHEILSWMPLMAGLAIAQGIEASTKINIHLKWPNDLLIHNQKVGGILCESFKGSPTTTCVVIGFGINVNLPQPEIPKELEETATSLHLHTHDHLDRIHILQSIIPAVEQGWLTLNNQGASVLKTEYSNRCSTIGKMIAIQFPDGSTLEGLAHAIGDYGQLQIQSGSSEDKGKSARIVDIHSGDIRHIRSINY